MALFGLRKKEESSEVKEAKDIIKDLSKEEKIMEKNVNKEEKMPETIAEEAQPQQKQDFAPLFVRVNKYRQILQTMNYLKTNLNAVKNSLSILKELDKLRDDNLKMVEDAVGKVEQKLSSLDSSFMRPSGYIEEVQQLRNMESFGVTLEDLKGQINDLKDQIKNLS